MSNYGKDEKMLILKNGYVLDPASGTEGYYDILIDMKAGKLRRLCRRARS